MWRLYDTKDSRSPVLLGAFKNEREAHKAIVWDAVGKWQVVSPDKEPYTLH